jgi:hypothetical protein
VRVLRGGKPVTHITCSLATTEADRSAARRYDRSYTGSALGRSRSGRDVRDSTR